MGYCPHVGSPPWGGGMPAGGSARLHWPEALWAPLCSAPLRAALREELQHTCCFESLQSGVGHAPQMKTKPLKYKIDFMKAQALAFLSDALESVNFERVFDRVRSSIRELFS